MNPTPDTNSDFNYPPLTTEDFERLWNYYKWDDKVVISRNGHECFVSVHFPLQSENDFNKFGFRVRIEVRTKFNGEGAALPCLKDSTPKVADKRVFELADFVCGLSPRKKKKD